MHVTFGNKVYILVGDYLLARASIFLARLRDVAVVEIMSGVIKNLIREKVMKMRGVGVAASGVGEGASWRRRRRPATTESGL